MFEARNAVAIPMDERMKLRRDMPGFLAFFSDSSPVNPSHCFCRAVCGRGTNSSLDTTSVGIGESTPTAGQVAILASTSWSFPMSVFSVAAVRCPANAPGS